MLKLQTHLTANTVRIPGHSAEDLSVSLSRLLWPSSEVKWRARTIALVSDDDWQQALAASMLIHAPCSSALLATNKNKLGAGVRSEIQRLSPSGIGPNGKELPAEVILVGSLDKNVRSQIQKDGFTTHRFQAENNYELAASIAWFITRDIRPMPPVVLVPYHNHLDSQSIAGLAAYAGAPILFVGKNNIPLATELALRDLMPSTVYLVGRHKSLVSRLVGDVMSLLPKASVIRIAGGSSPELSVNLARYMDAECKFGWGRNLPAGDIITVVPSNYRYAGILAAMLSHRASYAPILVLPKQDGIPDVIADYLAELNPSQEIPSPPFMRAWIIGDSSDGLSEWQQLELERMLLK